MSFKTSPNRIVVKDAAGATTLDTDQPMPHILQTAVVSKTVSFPATTAVQAHSHVPQNSTYSYQTCSYQNVCDFQYVCKQVWNSSTLSYETQCGYENVCSWQNVCTNNTGWLYTDVCNNVYAQHQAREWSQVQDLATILNGIEADFIQVSVESSRSSAGQDPYYGTFVGVVPAGRVLSQGSMILESGFRPGGSSWLRRIMSVYVEGGVVKVQFKHSNKLINGKPRSNGTIYARDAPIGTYPGALPFVNGDFGGEVVDTGSAFSVTFYITIGKFTK